MHPSQQFSCKGTHSKALDHKPKEPKLTGERLVAAIPKNDSVTQKQLARRVNCATTYTCKIANQAIEQGLIECFTVMGVEKHFRRVK